MPVATPDSYTFTPGTPLYAGLPTPSVGGLVANFWLDNWDSVTPTRVLFRGGHPFKKGDIPSGSVPEIRRAGGAPVAAQFDGRSTWSDGSLKFCVIHMRDTDLAGMASREYEIYPVTGSFDNTGATTLASVVASDALTVEFSSLTQFNGTTNVTRGAGAALAAFAAHAGVATRVTKIHSGPVCEGWQVWGMAKDGAAGAGSEDAHLKAIWYVDVWKDAGGTVIDTEFAAELAQDWWGVASKFRLDYTATLKRNGTTVQAYTGIQHPYHAHWLTARMQNDNNHGKRHWVGTVPSLLYKFSKTYWKSTKVLPPYDTAFVPTAPGTATYSPLSNQDHRAAVDGTGAYEGRGVLSNMDARAFMLQTAAANRASRVNAFAGLHYPGHYRDERTRTRPSESADVANTLVPLLWEPKASSASTFTGLPSPKHAYGDYRTTSEFNGGVVLATGGSGVWSPSENSSHAVPYSTYAYMLEGERYMLESVIDMATKAAHVLVGDQYGGRPFIHWYESTGARTEMSIPSTRWTGIPDLGAGQERSIGWSANLLGHAAALTPDNDAQGQYLKAWNEHCGDYMGQALLYTPPSIKAAGITYVGMNNQWMRNPWQAGIIIQGAYYNHGMTEVPEWGEYAEMVGSMTYAIANRALYELGLYRTLHGVKNVGYTPSDPNLAADQFLSTTFVTIASNRATVSSPVGGAAQAGEVIYFLPMTDGGGSSGPLPPEITEGTPYYLVSPSGGTFGISTSVGGSSISLTNGSYYVGGRFFAAAGVTPATTPPYLPPDGDTYWGLHLSAFAFSEREGSASVPSGTAAAVESFLSGVTRTNFPSWAMKVGA